MLIIIIQFGRKALRGNKLSLARDGWRNNFTPSWLQVGCNGHTGPLCAVDWCTACRSHSGHRQDALLYSALEGSVSAAPRVSCRAEGS